MKLGIFIVFERGSLNMIHEDTPRNTVYVCKNTVIFLSINVKMNITSLLVNFFIINSFLSC